MRASKLLSVAMCVAGYAALMAMSWRNGSGGGYGRFSKFNGGVQPPLGFIDVTGVNCNEISAPKKTGGQRRLLGGNCYIGVPPGIQPFENESNDQIALENDPLIPNTQRSAQLGKVARL